MSNASSKTRTFITRTISSLLSMGVLIASSSGAIAGRSDKPSTLVYPPWKHTLGLHRVGQRHLDLYSGYRRKFVDPRGVAATKLYFNDAPGPEDDFELTVYGVNAGTNEVFYNKSMVSLGFYGADVEGAAQLRDPVGICCDAYGNVFVADTGNNRIVHLVNDDNELEFKGSFDFKETGQPLSEPTGVALEGGELFVCDTANDRILVATPRGTLDRVLLDSDATLSPTTIAVIASPEYNIYGLQFAVVVDSLGQRLRTCTLDGSVLATTRYHKFAGGPGRFAFAAIDYHSNIYVTDMVSGCLFKFDRYLNFLTRIGCGRRDGGNLVEPRGLAVYRRFGQVFVAEQKGASYFWVGTDVEGLSCRARASDEDDAIVFDVGFLLTERSTVTVSLQTDTGKTVTELADRALWPVGYQKRQFRVARSQLPCSLANCKYRVTVTARATYSSRPYFEVSRSAPVR